MVFFMVIGLAVAVAGLRLLWMTAAFFRRAQRSSGVVTRLERNVTRSSARTPRNNVTYYAFVRFTTMEGREVEAKAPIASQPPPAQPGEVVDIFYDPADPSVIRIDSLVNRGYLLAGIATGFGLAFAAVGLVVVRL